MLSDNQDSIAFLFDSRFAEAFRVPAERVAIEYRITKDEAIVEFRRLLAIKVFTVDEKATKISPTPLSTQHHLYHLSYFMLTCANSGRTLALCHS